MSVCRNDVIDCHQKLSVNQTLFRLEPLFDFFFFLLLLFCFICPRADGSSYSEVLGTKLRSLGLAAIKRIDFPPPKANIGKTKGSSCSESNANLLSTQSTLHAFTVINTGKTGSPWLSQPCASL